jgi:hypothetical protein
MADVAVVLRTAHFPTVTLNPTAGGEPSPVVAAVMGWLKPEASLRTPFGSYTTAPYGKPGETSWPMVGLIGGGLLLLGAFIFLRGLWSLVKR